MKRKLPSNNLKTPLIKQPKILANGFVMQFANQKKALQLSTTTPVVLAQVDTLQSVHLIDNINHKIIIAQNIGRYSFSLIKYLISILIYYYTPNANDFHSFFNIYNNPNFSEELYTYYLMPNFINILQGKISEVLLKLYEFMNIDLIIEQSIVHFAKYFHKIITLNSTEILELARSLEDFLSDYRKMTISSLSDEISIRKNFVENIDVSSNLLLQNIIEKAKEDINLSTEKFKELSNRLTIQNDSELGHLFINYLKTKNKINSMQALLKCGLNKKELHITQTEHLSLLNEDNKSLFPEKVPSLQWLCAKRLPGNQRTLYTDNAEINAIIQASKVLP